MVFHFSDHIKYRLEKNLNTVIAITGEPQIGKSSAAIVIARAVDPNFGLDQVVFTPEEFLKLVKTKPNSAIVFDDAQVGWSYYNYRSKLSRSLNYAVQTCGVNHQLILLTMISIYMLDPNARRMVQIMIEMKDRGFGIISRVRENKWSKRLYFPPLEPNIHGQRCKLEDYHLPKPPDWIFERYIKKKLGYLNKLYGKIVGVIKEDNLEKAKNIVLAKLRYKTQKELAIEIGCSEATISRLKHGKQVNPSNLSRILQNLAEFH
jgi:DNA-binding Xre family transcriptional regulator